MSRPVTPVVRTLQSDATPADLLGCPYITLAGRDYDIANSFFEDCWLGSWSLPLLRTATSASILAGVQVARPASKTVIQYAHCSRNFITWMEYQNQRYGRTTDLLNATEADLRAYERAMQSGEWSSKGALSESTIRSRILNAISLCEWAAANGLRDQTGFRRILKGKNWNFKLLSSAAKKAKFPMPSSNLTSDFLRSMSSWNRTYFLAAFTMSSTGLRSSEMCAVNIDQIPFDRLDDPRWEGFTLEVIGKGKRHRVVVIGRDLVEAYKQYAETDRKYLLAISATGENCEAHRDASAALLVNGRGRRLATRSMWAAFQTCARLAGLPPVHPHLLRHWYAANRLRKHHEELQKKYPNRKFNTDELRSALLLEIASIKVELGHSNVETTLIYLDAYLEEIAQPQRLALQTSLWSSLS